MEQVYPSPEVLTRRQREVVTAIARTGYLFGAAEELGISRSTLETHRKMVYSKLRIHNVPMLVRYAVSAGLIEPLKIETEKEGEKWQPYL